MMIAQVRIYAVGRFTVREQPRPDNPYWPVYIVILNDRIVGKGFSKPNESDCQWMLANTRDGDLVYANPSVAKIPRTYRVKPNGEPRRTLTEGRKRLVEVE